MHQQDDRTFIKKFSGIVIGLLVFTVAIIVLAVSMQGEPDPNANPSQLSNAKQRIAPVAGVHTDASGAAELAQAQAEAFAAPAEAGGAVNGENVYNGLCQTCHAAGIANAPIPGSNLMTERAATGLDAMVANAINGIGIMPPRGGNMSISDDEIRAAVEYMMNQ